MIKSDEIKQYAKNKLYLNTTLLMTDNSSIEIDNVKKILEYNDIFLKIKTTNLIIQIWGSKISVNDYGSGGLVVNGKIESVEFLKSR